MLGGAIMSGWFWAYKCPGCGAAVPAAQGEGSGFAYRLPQGTPGTVTPGGLNTICTRCGSTQVEVTEAPARSLFRWYAPWTWGKVEWRDPVPPVTSSSAPGPAPEASPAPVSGAFALLEARGILVEAGIPEEVGGFQLSTLDMLRRLVADRNDQRSRAELAEHACRDATSYAEAVVEERDAWEEEIEEARKILAAVTPARDRSLRCMAEDAVERIQRYRDETTEPGAKP